MTDTTYHCGPDDPIYGKAGEPLDDATVKLLLDRQVSPQACERKRIAWKGRDIYREQLGPWVLEAIGIRQDSPTIRRNMAKQITGVRNDALDVTRDVAVVWKNGADRHLADDGDDKDLVRTDSEDVLRELAVESGFDVKAVELNHLAWLQGPQYAIPLVRGEGDDVRLCCDVVGPHIYDAVQNIADPLGAPVGLAWTLGAHRDGDVQEHSVYILDTVSLRRYVVRAGVHTPAVHTQAPDVVEHGYGKLPAACLRFSWPHSGDDWYMVESKERLLNGTIDVGVKMARMGLTRKSQCHKMLSLIGRLQGVPKGQEAIGSPETGFVADTGDRGAGSNSVELEVHDFDTDPKNFIVEVLFWVGSMVRPYGGEVQSDGSDDVFAQVVIPPKAQAEHRKAQIKPATKFCKDWWASATAMLRAEGHPAAKRLPKPADVHKNLRVNFGALNRDLEDPDKAAEFADWELSKGLTSEVKLMQVKLGGVSEEEAWREVERNMKNRSEFNDFCARYNLKAGEATSAITAPQAFGAQGTPVREENRAAAEAAQGDAADGGGQPAPEPT